MARKTLGKMEFESLINDLREQNEKTSDFQEESSIIFSNINSGISSLSLRTQKQNMLLEKFLVSQQDQNELLAQQVTHDEASSSKLQKYFEDLNLSRNTQEDEDKKSNRLLGGLLSFFQRKDREEKRKASEGLLEKVFKKDKKTGDITIKPGNLLPKKGMLGDLVKGLSTFLSTALLGVAGKGFLSSVLSGIRIPGFGLKLGKAIGVAILLPDLIKAFQAATKEKDFASGAKAGIKAFFGTPVKEGDVTAAVSAASGGALKGGIAGLAVAGPSGMIVGAILGGAYGAITSYFGTDINKLDISGSVEKFLFGTSGGDFEGMMSTSIIGAGIGAISLAKFGPVGMVVGGILGFALGAIKSIAEHSGRTGQTFAESAQQILFDPLTDMMMRYAKAYNAFMTGNFDQGMKLLKNESGLMMSDFVGKAKQLQKRIREGASVEDLMEDKSFYDLLESSILSSAMKQGATRMQAEEVLDRFKSGEKEQREVGQSLYDTGVGTREIDMLRKFLGTKDLTASEATKAFRLSESGDDIDVDRADMAKVFELLIQQRNLKAQSNSILAGADLAFKQAGLNFGVMDVASRTQDASGGTKTVGALDKSILDQFSTVKSQDRELYINTQKFTEQLRKATIKSPALEEVVKERQENEELKRPAQSSLTPAPVSVQDNSIMNYSTTNSLTEIAPMFSGMQYQTALG